ncbi:hypothetical protein CcCBS67573_g07297 [Chytriomyces confervae]|uniref:Reelin domain-containing protein n=1 Tax=Chytriomyces confervae TaxID=246404 RepID=A0A507EXM9_9FUNG|nr:hypothetical protein HDU80_006002 [Chytriomyces hyalinus]TPX68120.1 hypothetical protein CcCBS67573_g07297 [Chytriomyces confervae]
MYSPSILSFLATVAAIANALPTGAPRCIITDKVIGQGHLTTQNGAMGLKMTSLPTYTPGGPPIPITITGSFPVDMGVLMYVTPGSTQDSVLTSKGGATAGIKQHVGGFMDCLTHGMRAQTKSSCDAQSVVNEVPESTITHVAPLVGFRNSMQIMWTPPKTNQGVVTVNMVVAGNVLEPYMIVPSIQVMSTEGMMPGQSAVATNAQAAPPATVAGMAGGLLGNIVPNALQLPGTVVDDLNTVMGDVEAGTSLLGKLTGGLLGGK